MTFHEVEGHSGVYEYRGQEVCFEFYINPDGCVEKLAIHYPDDLFTRSQGPEFLRSGWPSKEEAIRAGMERAKEVIDRKI